jgi:predicted metal-dependent hydrolase
MDQKVNMKKIILLSTCIFLMSMPVAGEYYQYKDGQGNLRFTDDPANIPKEIQTDITAYESVENFSFEESLETSSSSDVISEGDTNVQIIENTEAEQRPEREVLDEMRAALDQTEASLKEQHEELKAQAPGKTASKTQTDEYLKKVDELKVKMADYQKQQQAYNEKVKAYNARIALENKKGETGEAR